MNSDDLALFAAVARAGSISRAAMELGADQSTVSRRVAGLESEAGGRLFHRSGRGVTLSERGRQLLVYADTVAGTLNEALRAMHNGAGTGPAQLRIGAQPTIAKMVFGKLGHALKGHYPTTRLRFVEGLANQLLAGLDDGEIDILLLYRPEHSGALHYDPLLHEGIRLVTPSHYPALPCKGEKFPVAMLGTVPLILPSTHHGIRVMAETLASRHGFSLDVALECDGSVSITKRLVMEGCGCTVLPLASLVDDVRAGRLKTYRLTDPAVSRCVALVLGKTPMESAELWQISRIIKETVVQLVESQSWPDAELDVAMKSGQSSAPSLRTTARAATALTTCVPGAPVA